MRDDTFGAEFFAKGHQLAMGVGKLLRRSDAPVATDGGIDGERVVFVFAGADFEGGGASADFEVGLDVAFRGEGDAPEGLTVDDALAFVRERGEEGVVGEERLGDEFVVVAAIFEVEAEDDLHVVEVEVAQAEIGGGLGEDGFCESGDLGPFLGVVGAEAERAGIEADVAFCAIAVVEFFEDESAFVASAEFGEAGEFFADALEEMEDGFARGFEFEFEEKARGNVEFVEEGRKEAHQRLRGRAARRWPGDACSDNPIGKREGPQITPEPTPNWRKRHVGGLGSSRRKKKC